METFGLAFARALELIARGDPELATIVGLSFAVSLTATAAATLLALPLGAVLAVTRFPGRRALIVLLDALLGLPSVVVGLVVYLMLSRAGPLGRYGILFTPTAMAMAQTILILPLMAAVVQQAVANAWIEYRELIASLGAGPVATVRTMLADLRFPLVTFVLIGFGRAVSEVGAVMIVGGNIDGVTRVMTTAIALETSKGDLPLALALGMVLLGAVLVLNVAAHVVRDVAQKRYG